MNIRELPRKVDGLPVVKAVYLGWLARYTIEGGYFCVVITYGEAHTRKGKRVHLYVMRALGLDRPWHRIENYWDLGNSEANAKFAELEKLAEWPEGNKG